MSDEMKELINRSSLGGDGASRLRDRTTPEILAEIRRRSAAIEAGEASEPVSRKPSIEHNMPVPGKTGKATRSKPWGVWRACAAGASKAWQRYQDLVVFTFVVATSVSALGGTITSVPVQLSLQIVALVAGLYLLVRLIKMYSFARNASHARELETYATAISRVAARQTPLYQEEVRVEIVIGRNDSEDLVREEVYVRPDPQVVQRLVRPIVPFGEAPRRLSDLEFTCQVDEGDDGVIGVTQLPVITKQMLRVWLIFDPPMRKPATWHFSYRPRGLWNPLRTEHRDTLVWHDRVGHGGKSPMTDFRVRFRFLDRNFRPRVVEQNNLGATTFASRGPDGEWIIDWRDSQPRGHRYTWEIIRVDHGGNDMLRRT